MSTCCFCQSSEGGAWHVLLNVAVGVGERVAEVRRLPSWCILCLRQAENVVAINECSCGTPGACFELSERYFDTFGRGRPFPGDNGGALTLFSRLETDSERIWEDYLNYMGLTE